MRQQLITFACCAAATAVLAQTSMARAETTVVTPPPAQPAPAVVAPGAEAEGGYNGPNRALLATGLITFGLSYVPAVIVAGTSNQDADHHLYVPIVGPWLDLANRPACGPQSVGCDTENTNKVLIGVDGVFQAVGVIATVASLLSPEHERAVVTTAKSAEKTGKNHPELHFSPARLGPGGYGVSAFGSF